MKIRVLWFDASAQGARLQEGAETCGLYVQAAQTMDEARFHLMQAGCDAAVISVRSLEDACEPITHIRQVNRTIPVVVACADASSDEIVRVTRLGAYHTFVGHMEPRRLAQVLAEARELNEFDSQGGREPWRRSMVGESPAMQRVSELITLVARRRSTVLITGQTGTGKEVVARAIHAASDRSEHPFVAVNCGAIPENLIESELFGYVKGAFTGATQNRAGLFEQAAGGTIFLDEIGELPLELQAKLLRVLQERELQRLGSSETVKLNVRIVAATNADLESAVQAKKFREDLYYRLSVVPVRLPSLRERPGDIPLLARHFAARICATEGIPLKRFSPEALRRLSARHWPGNVRQLEHAVEMAIVLSGDRDELQVADFFEAEAPASEETSTSFPVVPEGGLNFNETVSRFERRILDQALLRSGGNKARAAELLQIKRTTLLAKLKALDYSSADVLSIAAGA